MRLSIPLGVIGFVAIASASAMALRGMPRPEVGLRRAAGVPTANEASLRWEAQYSPAEDRDRLVAAVDGNPIGVVELAGDDGIALSLEGLSPGAHFLELSIERSGGRVTRISDQVLAGPWQSEQERGCDLGLAVGPAALIELLIPVLEAKIVAGAKHSEYFGATSYLSRKDLEVVDGGLRFDVTLDTREEGKGDIRVAGVVDLRGQGDAGITASLRSLDRATAGPKLEEIARAEGRRKLGAVGVTVGSGVVAAAGGGALLGLAAAAGGGWVGSKLGEKVGERTVRREARREAREQIESALLRATDAVKLPEAVTILRTEPALTGELRWCSAPRLSEEHGLAATLRLHFVDDEYSERSRQRAVYLGTALPPVRPPEPGSDATVHVDVAGDLINRILAEWTVRGGLQARLDRSGLRHEVQEALGERTRWRVTDLDVEVPPALRLHADGQIDATLAGVTLGLRDPERDAARTVLMGATGLLHATALAEAGQVRLGGNLDAAYLGCRELDGDQIWQRPCFSAVADPEVLRATLNDQLSQRSDELPVLDLGRLLRLRLASGDAARVLQVETFELGVGDGVLSIDARASAVSAEP